MTPIEADLLDPGVLEGYRVLQDAGEPDIVTEFIDVFLSDLPQRVTAIEESVRSSVPGSVRSAAHALKGSAATVGAVALTALCAELEEMGRDSRLAGADALAQKLRSVAEETTTALGRLRV